MTQPTRRPIPVFGKPGPDKQTMRFSAMTGCACGCGQLPRFIFQIGPIGVTITDPVACASLIEELRAGYALIFPDAPPLTAPETANQ
jgi:hypothetical protein